MGRLMKLRTTGALFIVALLSLSILPMSTHNNPLFICCMLLPAMTDLILEAGLVLSNSNAGIELQLTPEQKIKSAEIEKQQQQFIRSKFNQGAENPQQIAVRAAMTANG